ncbi:MAG: hypothetical protein QGH11_06320 [Pirellulaceae bacterium]|nr:hypothetical protein [Pirellulaceae bacterium]
MVQTGPGKNDGPGRREMFELLKQSGIMLVLVFSVCSLYALACFPPEGMENEAIRQPVDIAAPPATVQEDPEPVFAVDSGTLSSHSVPALPGIARPSRSDRTVEPRRVLLGVDTGAEHLAEILPDRYPGLR